MNTPAPLSTLKDLARMSAVGPIPTFHGGIESWQIELTPELAGWLLENNGGNRRISPSEVERIATDIAEGRWQINGDTVKVSVSGRLVDGQHRCLAVIKADRPVITLIAFEVADTKDVFATIDQQRQRSVRDIIETTTDRKIDNSHIASTNLLGNLTGGVDLSTKPRQAAYLETQIDEVGPWLSWAVHISDASPVLQNPMVGGRVTIRAIGKTPLTVLAVHMVRAGADPDSVQDFYAAMVGELPPAKLRELTDNQLAIGQIMLKRLKNGRVLNRVTSGGSVSAILAEYAVHINAYNKWVRDEKMEQARTTPDHYRYLGELPAVATVARGAR
jgi:hypothetical protein